MENELVVMTHDQLCTWMAALIDGEGSLMVTLDRDGCLDLRATIANTDRRLLDAVKERLGFGTIGTTGKPANTNWKEGFQWRCSRANVVYLLDMIEPYLIIKAHKAKIIRALSKTISNPDPTSLIMREKLLEVWAQIPDRGRGRNKPIGTL